MILNLTLKSVLSVNEVWNTWRYSCSQKPWCQLIMATKSKSILQCTRLPLLLVYKISIILQHDSAISKNKLVTPNSDKMMQNKTIQTTGWYITTARSYTHHTQLQRWTHQWAGSKETADQHSWLYSNLHVISLELSAILCQKHAHGHNDFHSFTEDLDRARVTRLLENHKLYSRLHIYKTASASHD